MPIAKVRLPDGRIGRFNVAEGTTPEQVVQFAQQQNIGSIQQPVEQPVEEKPSFHGAGFIEPATTLISGAIAEPLAGLAGLGKAAFAPSPEAAVERGKEAVQSTREALTYQPRTEAGQQALGTLGGVLEPVGRVLQEAETFLGDETFEATGSPALAAAATTIPTAIIEAIGLGASKGIVKGAAKTRRLVKSRAIKKGIVEAAPEREAIKNVARAVYKEIDDSGVTVTKKSFNDLAKKTMVEAKRAGLDPDVTPIGQAAINRLQREAGTPKTLTEIDTIRKVAQNAAKASGPDSAIGKLIIDNIDDFLDNASPNTFARGTQKAVDITPKYKIARELWGRAKRSELIEDAFIKAGEGDFAKDIVTQFKSILKDTKKRRKFFKPDEIAAMQAVTQGATPLRLARLIGKFGISDSQVLIGGLGATAGAAAFGAPGAVAIPVIGNVSKKLAARLTRKGAEFADAVVRAGSNADDIVKAYLKNVPKAARSAEELSELLLRPDIALDNLLTSSDKVLKTAAEIARGRQILAAAGTAGAAGTGVVREMGN